MANSFWDLLTLLLLLREGYINPPNVVAAPAFASLMRVSFLLQLADPREKWNTSSYFTELFEIRRRLRGLQHAPYADDAKRFCDRLTCVQCCLRSAAHTKYVLSNPLGHLTLIGRTHAIEAANHNHDAWIALRAAYDPKEYSHNRRESLQRLMGLIGVEDYGAAIMPEPCPIRWLRSVP